MVILHYFSNVLILGGTMFGTTPGGSKIVYDRLYLLKVRDSPASHVSSIRSFVSVVLPNPVSALMPPKC